MLTHEEFSSLLLISTPATYGPPTEIPPEHSARLIAVGYMADIQGRLRMTTPGRIRLAAGTPKLQMIDQWTEELRCRSCANTGIVSLSQVEGDQTPTVLSIPDGLKVVQTEYGPDFHCETCNVPALP